MKSELAELIEQAQDRMGDYQRFEKTITDQVDWLKQREQSFIDNLNSYRNKTEPPQAYIKVSYHEVEIKFDREVFRYDELSQKRTTYVLRDTRFIRCTKLRSRLAKHVMSYEDGWLKKGDISKLEIFPSFLTFTITINIGDGDDLSTARSKAIRLIQEFLEVELPKEGFLKPEFTHSFAARQ